MDNHPREEQLGPCQDQQLEQGPEQQRDQGADEAGQQAEQMRRPDVGTEQAVKQGIGLQITVGRVEEDGVILYNIIFHVCGGAEEVEELFQRHQRTDWKAWLLAILARVAGHAPLL